MFVCDNGKENKLGLINSVRTPSDRWVIQWLST